MVDYFLQKIIGIVHLGKTSLLLLWLVQQMRLLVCWLNLDHMEVSQVSWHRLMLLWQCYPTYSCFLLSAENEVLKLDQTNCTFGFEGKSALYLKYIASCPLYWEQWRWSTLRTKARYCSNFFVQATHENTYICIYDNAFFHYVRSYLPKL